MNPLPSPANDAPPGVRQAAVTVVGAHGIEPKDELVLRSILRIIGTGERSWRYAGPGESPHILFAAAHGGPSSVPRSCKVIRVGGPALTDDEGSVPWPLRLSAVSEALRAVAPPEPGETPTTEGDAPQALAPLPPMHRLYDVLVQAAQAREQGIHKLTMADRHVWWLDLSARKLHTPTPVSLARLAEDPGLAAAHIEPAADAVIPASSAVLRFADVLWTLSADLASRQVPIEIPSGALSLKRWPDAAALLQPGVPRLAAMMTQRPHGVDELVLRSGLSVNRVCWFLHAAHALGLVVVASQAARIEPPVALAAPANPAPGLLTRLRQRLKLW